MALRYPPAPYTRQRLTRLIVAELTPVLRRTNDPTALNRMDAGMVTPETFNAMVNDLEVVSIPKTPKK